MVCYLSAGNGVRDYRHRVSEVTHLGQRGYEVFSRKQVDSMLTVSKIDNDSWRSQKVRTWFRSRAFRTAGQINKDFYQKTQTQTVSKRSRFCMLRIYCTFDIV